MTIPRNIGEAAGRVADHVRGLFYRLRRPEATREELDLVPHLRGNEGLYKALCDLIEARIGVRATLSVPSDPMQCKAILDRDAELRWLLGRLNFVYGYIENEQPTDDGEQPS